MIDSMVTLHTTDPATRLAVLNASLHQLRREVDRLGAADIIHSLRNHVMAVQGALGLAQARLTQGRGDEVEALLDLADARLREGRALVARTQRARVTVLRPDSLAA